MRKLLALLLVIVLLAIGADVLAKRVAQERIASRLRSELRLRSDPDVSLGGRPFLVALVRGDIPDVHLAAEGVDFGRPVRLSEIELNMRSVTFSLVDVVDESGRVRLDGGTGTATVTESDLNETLANLEAPFSVAIDPSGVTAKSTDGTVETTVDVAVAGEGLSLGATGFASVPVELPGLGGQVHYESLSLEAGYAVLELSADRMTLDP